jgi:hypothetical protein
LPCSRPIIDKKLPTLTLRIGNLWPFWKPSKETQKITTAIAVRPRSRRISCPHTSH